MNLWQIISHHFAEKRLKKELTKAINQALESQRYYQILPSGHEDWAVQYRTVTHKNPFAGWKHFGVYPDQHAAQRAIENNLKMFAKGIADTIAEIERTALNPPYPYPNAETHRFLFETTLTETLRAQGRDIRR